LGPVGTGAEVFDPQLPAGDRVYDAAVAGAVVGQHAFHPDVVATVEGDRAAQEAGSGHRLLMWQHLCVGESAVVVDGDVDVLPTELAASAATAAVILACPVTGHAVTGASDPPQFLDVDMNEFARP